MNDDGTYTEEEINRKNHDNSCLIYGCLFVMVIFIVGAVIGKGCL